jgi:hypothetical protein
LATYVVQTGADVRLVTGELTERRKRTCPTSFESRRLVDIDEALA